MRVRGVLVPALACLLSLLPVRVLFVLRVPGVLLVLAVGMAGDGEQQQGDGGRACKVLHARSSTRTSRIIPASMW